MRKVIKYIFHLDHLLITILTFVLLVLCFWLVDSFTALDPWKKITGNLSMTDFFFKVGYDYSDVNQDITVVDIKDEFKRGNIARTIAKVNSLHPWITGVDIVFKGLKGKPESNQLLAETAEHVGDSVVWVSRLEDYDQDKKAFAGKVSSFFADSLGVKEGFANLDDNFEHKRIRNMLTIEGLGNGMMPSFPLTIAQALDTIEIEPHKKLTIDYAKKINIVPADSIDACEDLIKDHIVLIGSTTDENDKWDTPLGKLPGVVIQAYSVLTARDSRDISYASLWTNMLIAFVLCYIFTLLINACAHWSISSNTAFGQFLVDSLLLNRILSLVFLGLVAFGILELFLYYHVYVDAILILLLLGFVIVVRPIYIAAVKALSRRHNWKFLKNSLFNTNKK